MFVLPQLGARPLEAPMPLMPDAGQGPRQTQLGLGCGRRAFSSNVDPVCINPNVVFVGIHIFGGKHPHITKQRLINPGSTFIGFWRYGCLYTSNTSV